MYRYFLIEYKITVCIMTLHVINTDLAHFILHHRCQDGKESIKEPVNIRCCVLCISEVIRIKDSQLFLMKLGPTVNIVVKIENLSKWHEKVSLHKEVVFTCVRPTTLQKGSKNAQRVYAATERSELLQTTDTDCIVSVKYSDWLHQHGCGNVHHTPDLQRTHTICDNLFSYQGIISNILDGGMGVYELDSTVRLYVSKVPAVHKCVQLQIGANIIIQNAHHRVSPQNPKLSIYCCMLTSVKVTSCGRAGRAMKASDALKKVLYTYDQKQNELDHIFEARQSVRNQFLGLYSERLIEKMFSVLILCKDMFDHRHSPRNVLDEFLSQPHQCLLQDTSMIQYKRQFVSVDAMRRSIPDILSDSLGWQCIRQTSDSTQVIIGILDMNEENGEIYLKDCSGNLGILTSSCHENRKEADGYHECSVSCDCSDLRPGDTFQCPYVHPCCIGKTVAITSLQLVSETMFTERRMLFKNLKKDDNSNKDVCDKYMIFSMKDAVFISHFKSALSIDTVDVPVKGVPSTVTVDMPAKDLGVCINQRAVTGKTLGSNTDTKSVQNTEIVEMPLNEGQVNQRTDNVVCETSNLHKHVRMDGSTYFCRKTTCSVKSSISMLENSALSMDADLSSKNKKVLGRTTLQVKVEFNRKRSRLDVEPVLGANDPKKKVLRTDTTECGDQDILAGNLNQTAATLNWHKTADRENSNQQQSVGNWENSNQQQSVGNRENSNQQQSVGNRETVIYLESKGSLMADKMECRFTAECLLLTTDTNVKVILEFRRRASRWYHTLYPGGVYVLSVLDTAASVLSRCLSAEKLHKVLLKSNTTKLLCVHIDVMVRRMWDTPVISPDHSQRYILCTIEDVLNTNFTDKFVSFEGFIIGRHLVKPGFGPRHNLEEKGACGMFSRLHVQDVSKKNDIWVYLNDDTIINYQGLIPGARVRFYGLERKVSKSSNVYCRLTAVSSVSVLAVYSESTKEVDLQCDPGQSPAVYLSDLWTMKPTRGQVFQCVCDVEKILKISLKCLCEKCGSQIVQGSCSNKACDSGLGHRFLARASAIFDDGTCVAMVTLTGSSVQSMLQLSTDQWKSLEEEVRISGEIFVQQCNPVGGTDMDKFIYCLCDNHLVKKTWLLTFRTKYALDIDNIHFDEFSVKHFDTGTSRLSTKCLPFLQLECLTLTTFDPIHWSMTHILHPDSRC